MILVRAVGKNSMRYALIVTPFLEAVCSRASAVTLAALA